MRFKEIYSDNYLSKCWVDLSSNIFIFFLFWSKKDSTVTLELKLKVNSAFGQIIVTHVSNTWYKSSQKGWLKSVDVVLPKSWSLEKCYLTERTVVEKRIPTRDKTDILIHGKTKKKSSKNSQCVEKKSLKENFFDLSVGSTETKN